MNARKFTLRTENWVSILGSIVHLIEDWDYEKPLEIVAREYKRNRSLEQNARLHKIIGMCAKESGYTIEEMKITFKKELLSPITYFDYFGHKCPIYKSSATMKVAELSSFMNDVENLAAEWYGVRLPALVNNFDTGEI